MFGFLNVYKPAGMTSHDVVAVLRRITKIKQIGHTGTLDPFAEGVLPVCIGKATRLIEYLSDDKAYIATVQFGSSTTTYDIEGDIVNSSDKKVDLEGIEKNLEFFKGDIEQIPPIFSAIKVKGKKLYEYAREGKDVEIQPRKVNISKLEIKKFDKEKQQLSLMIECSKGTYIRSIANDLGEKLGVYAHLIKLERIKAGDFNLEDSINLNLLDTKEKVLENLIYPTQKLNFPTYELTEEEKIKVSNGMALTITDDFNSLTPIKLMYKGELTAIGRIVKNQLKCEKVFI